MDLKRIGTFSGIAVAVFVAGILVGTNLSCFSKSSLGPEPPKTPTATVTKAMPPAKPRVDTVSLLVGVPYAVEGSTFRTDTLVLRDTVVLLDTVYLNRPISGGTTMRQELESMDLKGLIPSLAGPIIAAFKPQTPRNTFELYGHAAHDLLQGGYSGGCEFDFNLDQIHVANATLYADAGYHRALYCDLGVRGKLYGFW